MIGLATTVAGASGRVFQQFGPDIWPLVPPNYEAYKRYTAGYEIVSEERKQELLGQVTHTRISPTHVQFNPQGALKEVLFQVNEPKHVSVMITTHPDTNGSLRVLEAEFQGLRNQVTILQSRFNTSQIVPLGVIESEKNALYVRSTSASEGIDAHGFSEHLFSTESTSLIYSSILQCLPIIGMRLDNYTQLENPNATEEEKKNALLNDVPLFTDIQLREGDDGTIMVEVWQGYTAEDGGHGRDPRVLHQRTGPTHRMFDYDVSIIITMTPEGKVVKIVHQEDRKGSHQIIDDPMYDFSDSPRDPREITSAFYFHSVPDHGMISRGLQYDEKSGQVINRVFRSFPDFYPWEQTLKGKDLLRVRKRVAVEEYLRETEMYINQFNAQRPIPLGGYHMLEQKLALQQFLLQELELLRGAA